METQWKSIARFVHLTNSWFVRGACQDQTIRTGVTAYEQVPGESNLRWSSRVVVTIRLKTTTEKKSVSSNEMDFHSSNRKKEERMLFPSKQVNGRNHSR